MSVYKILYVEDEPKKNEALIKILFGRFLSTANENSDQNLEKDGLKNTAAVLTPFLIVFISRIKLRV